MSEVVDWNRKIIDEFHREPRSGGWPLQRRARSVATHHRSEDR